MVERARRKAWWSWEFRFLWQVEAYDGKVNFSSLSECAEADHLSCFVRAG